MLSINVILIVFCFILGMYFIIPLLGYLFGRFISKEYMVLVVTILYAIAFIWMVYAIDSYLNY